MDVENRWLRETNTEVCKLVDVETELEQSRAVVVTLTDRASEGADESN